MIFYCITDLQELNLELCSSHVRPIEDKIGMMSYQNLFIPTACSIPSCVGSNNCNDFFGNKIHNSIYNYSVFRWNTCFMLDLCVHSHLLIELIFNGPLQCLP